MRPRQPVRQPELSGLRVVTVEVAALRRAVAALVVGLWLVGTAYAVPLSDYSSRIERAADAVGAMYNDDDEGGASGPEALELARSLLPPKETVELGDVSIEVDDSWLDEQIADYHAAEDASGRATALERIAARLYAIQFQLARIEAAPAHATPDEVAKLREILARPEFQPPAESAFAKRVRELRDAALQKLQEILEWLFGGSRGRSTASGMRVVILALGAVALLLLIRAIAVAVARRGIGRRGDRVKRKKKARVVLGEEVDESTTATDIAAAARALAATGDFRGAIRKLFVALIYQLDERGLVRLRAEATNREYLALVRGLGALYPLMSTMTDVFERVWYGEEPVDRAAYDAFETMYTRSAEVVAESMVAKTA